MPFLIEIRQHKIRFVKTVSLWMGYMAVGMGLAIAGPTLLDLQEQVQTGITQISFLLTSRAGGFVAGSLIMGIIYSRVNIFLATSITFAASAALTSAVPHMTTLWPLLLVFVLNGACLGFFEAACNVTMLFLWGKEAMPFMQALNFMYGTGAMIAPLIAEPFLLTRNETADAAAVNASRPYEAHPEDVMLIFPYSIAALLLLICAVTNFILWIVYPKTSEHPSRRNTGNNNSNEASSLKRGTSVDDSYLSADMTNIRRSSCMTVIFKSDDLTASSTDEAEDVSYCWWKILTLGLVFLFMHIYLGLEITFGSYLTTYVVKSDLKLSKTTGAQMTTLFWATFTFTKVVTIFYINWVGNQKNLIISLVFMLIASSILKVFASSSVLLLWLGVGLTGVGLSSVWGCMFGFLEDFFPVTSLIGSLMIVSAMLGEFVFPVLISSFIESYPEVLMWIVVFCSTSMTILFFLIVIVCNFKLRDK